MHRLIRRLVMGLLCGWLAVGAAPAQYNYQNYLLGDRAAGMGGAAAASAEGVDACYYNPAGLAQMRGNSLSLSGSLYGKQSYRSEDGMFPGEDARYNSFVTIPTTVGGVWKVQKQLTLAFSVLVPDRMAYNEMRSFRNNTHVYNYSADEQMLWFGPSVGWQVDERLSCGVSVFAVHRSYNEQLSLIYQENNQAYARGLESRNWGLLAAAGVQYQLFDRLRLGAKLQAPSLHVTGSGNGHAHIVTREETINIQAEEMGSETRVPAQVSLGLSWGVPRAYTLAADVIYYRGESFDLRYWRQDGERHAVRVERSDVVNCNLGLEYYLYGIFPLRTGFFTNFSAAPSVEVDNRDHSLRMDAYGISASVGREQGHLAANIGVIYVFGSGRSLGWDTEDDQVVNAVTQASQKNIYLMLNTAYLF